MKHALIERFLTLVTIDSPSGEEEKLRTLITTLCIEENLPYTLDERGNLFVCVNCTERPPITFAAHLDTVANAVGVKPVVDGEHIRSDGTTALGADNKIAVALSLVLIQYRKELGPFGLLFTVQEEVGLKGAKRLGENIKAHLTSLFAFDSSKAVGTLILQATAKESLCLLFHGTAAHAGVSPERGISAIATACKAIAAMQLLRIDAVTTANIGSIHGGTSTNVVCDLVEAEMEIRSLEEERIEAQLEQVRRCCLDACIETGGTYDLTNSRAYPGYRIASSDAREHFKAACASCSIPYTEAVSQGGSDVNLFRANGIDAVLLGAGYTGAHGVEEAIAIEEIGRLALLARVLVGPSDQESGQMGCRLSSEEL